LTDLLAGVNVVEVASGVAGPFAARLLADVGANCIKIEPRQGDISRSWGPFPEDRPDKDTSCSFIAFNFGKTGLVLDLDTEEGESEFQDLLSRANILVEDGSLNVQEILHDYSDLVIVSVTGTGRSGLYKGRATTEITSYAMGGAMSSTGLPAREPHWLGGSLVQAQAGNVAACAAVAGLFATELTGRGQHIDVSWIEAELASMERAAHHIVTYTSTGINAKRQPPKHFPLPTGILPSSDGYVVASTYGWHIRRMLDAICSPRLEKLLRDEPANIWRPESEEIIREEVLGWLSRHGRYEASRIAQACGWCVTPVNNLLDLAEDPWLAAVDALQTAEGLLDLPIRVPGPSYKVSGGPRYRGPAPKLRPDVRCQFPAKKTSSERTLDGAANVAQPLNGVRVLDLCVALAGPFASLVLADLGAEVIQIESCQHYPSATKGPRRVTEKAYEYEDNIRRGYVDCLPGDRPWDRYSGSRLATRNKLSMTVDLTRPDGRNVFLELCEKSDCLLENNSPRLLQHLNLTWDVLHQRNPRLVLVRMPPLTCDGDAANVIGIGSNFEALAGLLSFRGYPDVNFESVQPTYRMDAITGPTAAMAAILALRRARVTGQGAEVVLSQTVNMLQHVSDLIIGSQVTGTNPARLGNRHPRMAPHGCYSADGMDEWVTIACRDDQDWRALVNAMCDPPWAQDPQLESLAGRLAHVDFIDRKLEQWTRDRPAGFIENMLARLGVPAARVRKEADKLADPHLRDRDFFRTLEYSDAGRREHPGHLWRSSAGDLSWGGPSPTLGQHNEYVYRTILGYSEEEIERLREAGHIASRYDFQVDKTERSIDGSRVAL